MNIHYDVTGLLTVVWRSHSGQIVWPAAVGQGRVHIVGPVLYLVNISSASYIYTH